MKPYIKDIIAIIMSARKQMRGFGASRFDTRAHPWPQEGWIGDFWYTPRETAHGVEAGKKYRLIGYDQDYDGGKGSICGDALIRIPTREEFSENPDPDAYVVEVSYG